jgi:hypothetical protein
MSTVKKIYYFQRKKIPDRIGTLFSGETGLGNLTWNTFVRILLLRRRRAVCACGLCDPRLRISDCTRELARHFCMLIIHLYLRKEKMATLYKWQHSITAVDIAYTGKRHGDYGSTISVKSLTVEILSSFCITYQSCKQKQRDQFSAHRYSRQVTMAIEKVCSDEAVDRYLEIGRYRSLIKTR